MSEAETIRLIGELLGVIGLAATGVWWLARQIWKVLDEVRKLRTLTEKLDAKQQSMNGSVGEHIRLDDKRFGDLTAQLSRIEGRWEEHMRVNE